MIRNQPTAIAKLKEGFVIKVTHFSQAGDWYRFDMLNLDYTSALERIHKSTFNALLRKNIIERHKDSTPNNAYYVLKEEAKDGTL